MVDPLPSVDSPAANACPWCSAAVTAETAVCPSCNAILIPEQETDVPGLTSVDQAAAREKRPAPRGRFLSWLGGDQADQTSGPADAQAIALPDADVQREILRLQLEAEIANLQKEADSIMSDALVEGRVNDLPEGMRPVAAAEASAETPAETADAMVAAAMATDAPAVEAGPVAEAAPIAEDAAATEIDPATETGGDATETTGGDAPTA